MRMIINPEGVSLPLAVRFDAFNVLVDTFERHDCMFRCLSMRIACALASLFLLSEEKDEAVWVVCRG